MKVWHPSRWASLATLRLVRPGDAIRNPVADARGDWRAENAARKLAAQLDAALAARGLRIDHPACVVGFVETLREERETR